jgi:hypothetical protein
MLVPCGNFHISKILEMSKCQRASFSPKDKAKRSKLKAGKSTSERWILAINFSSVSYPKDSYAFAGIIDFIKNSIIPDANSPIISGTGQLMASGGAWNLGQCFNTGNDTIKNSAGKRLQIAFRVRSTKTSYTREVLQDVFKLAKL